MYPCFLGDGKIVLEDELDIALNNGLSCEENGVPIKRQRTTTHPVDLELEVVLGKMPRKVFGCFEFPSEKFVMTCQNYCMSARSLHNHHFRNKAK